ncbi:MAG: hypothetical protein KAT15_14295, partial [Bacteroidales bacterium]|nr:hypothetical protein [Bacteroidales bacterium]
IRGFMEAIVHRYQVMLPVTAGKDSRTLLAASRNFTNRVYYYINKVGNMTEDSPDVAVPVKLMPMLGLDFHIEIPDQRIEEDFRKVYFHNNPYASEGYLPLIHHYHSKFPDRVNLPGNMASAAFEIYRGRKMKITPKSLARLNRLDRFQYALSYYERWISGCRDLCSSHRVSMLNLFYWEERLANWGTQIQMEKDLAQEDINPFNSRDLTVLYLSVHPRYIVSPYYKLHSEVIRNLWPEVLGIRINTSRRNSLLKVGKSLGILDLYYRIKYSWINNY